VVQGVARPGLGAGLEVVSYAGHSRGLSRPFGSWNTEPTLRTLNATHPSQPALDSARPDPLNNRHAVRKRLGRWLLSASLGVLVPPASLVAQTLPVPRLPPAPEPTPSPDPPPTLAAAAQPAEVPAPERPRPWEYSTGIGVRWDSNLDFLVPDGPSGLAVVPRGSLARVFWSPRGQVRTQAAGRFVGYADQNLRSRGYLDLGLDGGYRSSPSTTWRGSATYALGHSDSSQPLVDQGVLVPLVKTRTFTGSLGMSRQIGPRTSLRLDGRVYRIGFDSPDLVDGESLRGTVGLDLQLGSRNTVGIVYSLEDVLAGAVIGSYFMHFGSLQWTRVLSPRTAVLIEAGAGYTPDAVRANLDREQSFFGGASLTRQVRRASLIAFVRREVVPAFGVGASRLEVRAGLSATAPLGRDWRLRMASTHVRPDSPAASPRAYASADEASVALVRRLGMRLELSGDVLYRRRGATQSLPAIESFQAGLFLTLLSPSVRASEPEPGR